MLGLYRVPLPNPYVCCVQQAFRIIEKFAYLYQLLPLRGREHRIPGYQQYNHSHPLGRCVVNRYLVRRRKNQSRHLHFPLVSI